MVAHLEPLQQRYNLIMSEQGYLDEVLAKGAGARRITNACMSLISAGDAGLLRGIWVAEGGSGQLNGELGS